MYKDLAKRLFLLSTALLVLVILPACGGNDDDDDNTGTNVGDIAMNFTGMDQNGNTVNLSDYNGMVILMDFSTRWCLPCQDEASKAEALYQQYKDQGFVIITILVEGRTNGVESTLADLQAWASQFGLTFPVINDPGKTAWNNYKNVNEFPLNIVIDRNRVIKYKSHGYDEAAITGAINSLL